jgi:signal transduction histidine kinase
MAQATASFAAGDFSVRVPVQGADEIEKWPWLFNNMASSLAVLESTRRSFVANVSHELKTP